MSFSLGSLEVRMARDSQEIFQSQKLRYRVFYEEMGSIPPCSEIVAQQRDFDIFDDICHHLVALDHEKKGEVIGSYRLITREFAFQCGGFFSESEFDLTLLDSYPGSILELGRACIDPAYRSRGVIHLIWKALADYARSEQIDLMFGCASFATTKKEDILHGLTYLYHHCLAPLEHRVTANSEHYVDLNQIPLDQLDIDRAYKELTPLVKGYLRIGGCIGDGAFLDHAFGSIDVCILFEMNKLQKRYASAYGPLQE